MSRWLTLAIEHSDDLFHDIDECGEFGGFSFSNWSDGQNRHVWIINGRQERCGAMKHKVDGDIVGRKNWYEKSFLNPDSSRRVPVLSFRVGLYFSGSQNQKSN